MPEKDGVDAEDIEQDGGHGWPPEATKTPHKRLTWWAAYRHQINGVPWAEKVTLRQPFIGQQETMP